MRPPGGAAPRLRTLEYGRFAAASVVVVNHTIDATGNFASAGTGRIFGGLDAPGILGVEYFFVLSGFVMLVAHAADFGRGDAAPRFWWRRICRIYPSFWLVLLIAALDLQPHLTWAAGLGLASLLSPDVAHYIAPAWTLRYEIAFYFVFGLALLPLVGRWLLALWILVLIWTLLPVAVQNLTATPLRWPLRHILIDHPNLLMAPLDALFVAGLAAAALYLLCPLPRRLCVALIAAGAALLLAAAPAMDWYARYPGHAGLIPLGAGFGALILGGAGLERAGAWRGGRLAGWLGDMSYPLYLLHVPLLMIAARPFVLWLRPPLWGLYLLFVAGLILAYAGAAALTFAFDRPVRRALRRLAGRAA